MTSVFPKKQEKDNSRHLALQNKHYFSM